MADVGDELLPAQKLVQKIALMNHWEKKDNRFHGGSRTVNGIEFEVGKQVIWRCKREEWLSGATYMSVLSLIDCFVGDSPIKQLTFCIQNDNRYDFWMQFEEGNFEEGNRIFYLVIKGDDDVLREDVVSTDHFLATIYDECFNRRGHDRVLVSMKISGTEEADITMLSFKPYESPRNYAEGNVTLES